MKVIYTSATILLFRFDRNESVWDELTTYIKTHALASGTFSAIGACSEVILSYYDLAHKLYKDQTISEDLEILTITGNIAQMDTTYIIHAHGSFGREDFSVLGGHIKKLVVSATCELTLQLFSQTNERTFDAETGLNLLK